MKRKRLSEAQRKVLQNAKDCIRLDNHIHGQSAYGGLSATMFFLRKYGLIERDGFGITDAGLAAVETGNCDVDTETPS